MTLRSLSEFLEQQELAEQATILVFRDDGTVLAHSAAAPLVIQPGSATQHLATVDELDELINEDTIAGRRYTDSVFAAADSEND